MATAQLGERLREFALDFALVDLEVLEELGEVGVGGFQEFEEPMLDLDVGVGIANAHAERPFEGFEAERIDFVDESLWCHVGHGESLSRLA